MYIYTCKTCTHTYSYKTHKTDILKTRVGYSSLVECPQDFRGLRFNHQYKEKKKEAKQKEDLVRIRFLKRAG